MQPTRRSFLGTVSASLTVGLAGCTSNGSSDTTTEPATTPSTPAPTDPPAVETTTAEPAAPTRVAVRSHSDHGQIIVDGDGLTLYMFDNDPKGAAESACTGGCATSWPPLTTDADPEVGDDVAAEVTTFERSDGTTQVAVGGWPLYYYSSDSGPGEATGQGVGDVWWVLTPDGTPQKPTQVTVDVRSHSEHGDILVDGEGMTLYMFDQDAKGGESSACSGGCAEAWPPLTTEAEPDAGDGVAAELTTFERADGSTQVAADGWPLYYYSSDESPGDGMGQGVNDVWWVLEPDGTPHKPSREGGGGGDDGDGYEY